MTNPWEEISLSDYEKHMSLESVKQLQAMNELMKKQFTSYPTTSAMVLGIAGGNGLEHINPAKYQKVYGVDINQAYLTAVKARYVALGDILVCHRIDILNEADKLPNAELLIANLLIEYIGYDAFKKAVLQSQAQYVSCIIQLNIADTTWVSDSPYLHAFDGLNCVHHQIEAKVLIKAMNDIGFKLLKTEEYPLPNGKKLIMLDFMGGHLA